MARSERDLTNSAFYVYLGNTKDIILETDIELPFGHFSPAGFNPKAEVIGNPMNLPLTNYENSTSPKKLFPTFGPLHQ